MHRDDVVVLAHRSRPDTTELLHVSTDTQEESQVHAERTDVRSRLARDPEDTEVAVVVELDQLAVVDRTDTELTLDGRNEGRSLEEGSGESFDRSREGLLGLDRCVKTKDADVLLTCSRGVLGEQNTRGREAKQENRRTGTLLRLDQPRRAVDTDGQATRDLGIERSRVSSLLAAQDPADPSDDLVRRRVRGLVEVDHTRLDVRLEVTLQRRGTSGDGGEVRACGASNVR